MQRSVSPAASDEVSPTGASAIAAQGLMDVDHEDGGDGRSKAKRELSQSKRAAQNRAAQRAFRQRKEHYIKKLEQQVRDFHDMEQNFKTVQADNYALRDYVIQLQHRLLDHQVDPPQAPSSLNIPAPARAPPAPSGPLPAPQRISVSPPTLPLPIPTRDPISRTASAGTLADVAAAVAGLRAKEPSADGLYAKSAYKSSERLHEEARAEELRRLHHDNILPPPSSLRV